MKRFQQAVSRLLIVLSIGGMASCAGTNVESSEEWSSSTIQSFDAELAVGSHDQRFSHHIRTLYQDGDAMTFACAGSAEPRERCFFSVLVGSPRAAYAPKQSETNLLVRSADGQEFEHQVQIRHTSASQIGVARDYFISDEVALAMLSMEGRGHAFSVDLGETWHAWPALERSLRHWMLRGAAERFDPEQLRLDLRSECSRRGAEISTESHLIIISVRYSRDTRLRCWPTEIGGSRYFSLPE